MSLGSCAVQCPVLFFVDIGTCVRVRENEHTGSDRPVFMHEQFGSSIMGFVVRFCLLRRKPTTSPFLGFALHLESIMNTYLH